MKNKPMTQETQAAANQAAQAQADRKAKARKRRRRAARDLVIRLALLLLVVYVLFFHLVGVAIMPNGDMYPRVDAGDLVLYYRLDSNIRAQDIIVFKKPTASLELPEATEWDGDEEEIEAAPAAPAVKPEKSAVRKALDWLGFQDPNDEPTTLFVCRVVATAGDTVEISEGERLIVNGNTMIESNIFYPTPEYYGFVNYPLTLGEGEYFVLADYRNGGSDSRFFGAVREDEILGTVITIMRRNKL